MLHKDGRSDPVHSGWRRLREDCGVFDLLRRARETSETFMSENALRYSMSRIMTTEA